MLFTIDVAVQLTWFIDQSDAFSASSRTLWSWHHIPRHWCVIYPAQTRREICSENLRIPVAFGESIEDCKADSMRMWDDTYLMIQVWTALTVFPWLMWAEM